MKLLLQLMSHSMVPQLLFDHNGRFVSANDLALTLIGIDQETGHDLNCFTSPVFCRLGSDKAASQTLRDGQSRTLEERPIRLNELDLDVRQIISRIEIDGLFYLLVQLMDLTEQRRLVDALQTSNHQLLEQKTLLEESERRFHLAMNAAEEGIWDWRTDTGVVYYSPGYAIMLGYNPATFLQSVSSWLDLIHPDDKQSTLELSGQLLQTRGLCTLEFRMRHADGSYRWILSNGKVIERDANDKPLRAIGTHIDITQRKADEFLLQQAKHDAQAARTLAENLLEEQKQFLLMISHEIRNPLAIIDSATQVLEIKPDFDTHTQLLIARIKRGLARANAFVSHCLTEEQTSRLATEGLVCKPEALNLITLFDSVIKQVMTTDPECRVETQVKDCNIVADSALLQILLLNLIGNAIKYSPISSLIQLTGARSDRGEAILTIRDEGIGIPQEDLPSVNQRYVRGKNAAQTHGLGLGLHLVVAIAEIHKGTVEIDSELGTGTTITVRLPQPATDTCVI